MSGSTSPLIDTQGKQIGWMASMNDITEPKRTRVELEQAHERFGTVIDGLDAAVHVTDARSGEILFANRAFGNIFGHDSVGRSSATVTAAVARHRTIWRSTRQPWMRKRSRANSTMASCANLSGRWYHVHEQAIRWVDGRTVRVQIAADITERKHLDEVTLRAAQKRPEQTSRLITMGEMASSLAHELNQPLRHRQLLRRLHQAALEGNPASRTSSPPCTKPPIRPNGPARSSAACATW